MSSLVLNEMLTLMLGSTSVSGVVLTEILTPMSHLVLREILKSI